MNSRESTPVLSRRILRAGMFVSLAHVLFKLAGLIQARVVNQVLPAEIVDVVYVFAFDGCVFMLFLIGEEIIGPALLPVFMGELDTRGEKAAWRFGCSLLTLQTLLILGVGAGVFGFAPAVVSVLTQWSPVRDPERFSLAVRSVRRLIPALLGLSLGSTTYILLNAHKRFFLAAFGDAVWKFTVVFFLIFAMTGGADPLRMLIAGLLVGSLLKVLTHAVGLRDKLRDLRPNFAFSSDVMRRMAWLALPLLGGILFAKVRDNFNNVWILSSLDSDGLMQANSMGKKIFGAMHYVVPYALSIAVFPFFCELVDRKDRKELGRLITGATRLLLTALLPFSLLTAALAEPVTAILFRGGYFDATAVVRTSLCMALYTLVIPAAGVEALLMQGFFADRRMVSAVVLGIVFSTFSMACSWMGLRFAGGNEFVVLASVAGGFTLSRILKSLALGMWLKRKVPAFPVLETTGFLVRVLFSSLLGAGMARGLAFFLADSRGGWETLSIVRIFAVAGVSGGVGAVAVLLLLFLFRVPELRRLIEIALARIRGNPPSPDRPNEAGGPGAS